MMSTHLHSKYKLRKTRMFLYTHVYEKSSSERFVDYRYTIGYTSIAYIPNQKTEKKYYLKTNDYYRVSLS